MTGVRFIVALSVVLSAETVFSQDILKGISTVAIQISDAQTMDTACGLTGERTRLTVAKALLDGGVRVDSGSPVRLFVGISTINFSDDDLCVSNIAVQLFTTVPVKLPTQSSILSAKVELAQTGTLTSSDTPEHPKHFDETLTRLVTEAVTKIRLANQ